ncbi:MAG: C4-dicarboxylate ABC transporter substrate-binding protein [Deltaproteobacteria bacterium HGW-Deltaproteobacteria-8]|jgi:tripartite-type tricarboxylate transporter receptor subunit TctC|nr:MAG: C4-dicarboxylate ABC transporter substrate-binding protein [Deltaproteobacteria bacterium HGW-Deltaproteobacteria-8]
MRKKFTNTAIAVLAALIVLGTAAVGFAETYPDKPISAIVTYSPGGATDYQARVATMEASDSKYFGQPIVIINKPGAGGKVGWNWIVERAPKDGYTMVTYNIPHFIAQSLVFKTSYGFNTFEPLANWGADPAVLVVPKESPFNSIKDLVEFAKKNPGKVTINGAGLYVGHHIAALQLMKATGIVLTYIPEQGGTDAMQSVIANKVTAGFNNLSDAYRNKQRVKILGIADDERDKDFLPEVPTFKEAGYPQVDETSVNLRGLAFPKGVDPAIIKSASETLMKMFQSKKVKEAMTMGGCPLKIMSRDQVIKMFNERQKTLGALFPKK